MFLLKIILQNSVSTCIKNICPLSILLLVSICIWWNRFLDFGPNRRYRRTVPVHGSAEPRNEIQVMTKFFSYFWQIISWERELKTWWSCILLDSSACALGIPSDWFTKNSAETWEKAAILKVTLVNLFFFLYGRTGPWTSDGSVGVIVGAADNRVIEKSRSRFGGIRARL